MTVKNAMEEIVRDVIEEYKDQLKIACGCQNCLRDVLALSLNHLPPKYVADPSKIPFIKALYMKHTQEYANVLTTVTQAAEIVAANPHCPLHEEVTYEECKKLLRAYPS
ncbi:late competence development ComFB family protein [Bacillus sp. REN10]|uniref:late competence development ComFB family protein n=1 Tax=Bacillus sp. REN10 TaxID=2782541 RepID=UPI00193BFEA8|nr:late competence development ComFB family protein [Bacillus sp. REN10]